MAGVYYWSRANIVKNWTMSGRFSKPYGVDIYQGLDAIPCVQVDKLLGMFVTSSFGGREDLLSCIPHLLSTGILSVSAS